MPILIHIGMALAMYLIWWKRLSAINAKKNLTQPNVVCYSIYLRSVYPHFTVCSLQCGHKWQHYWLRVAFIYYIIPFTYNNRSFVQPNLTVFSVHCILIRNNKMAGHVDNFTIFIFLLHDKGSSVYPILSLYFHCICMYWTKRTTFSSYGGSCRQH